MIVEYLSQNPETNSTQHKSYLSDFVQVLFLCMGGLIHYTIFEPVLSNALQLIYPDFVLSQDVFVQRGMVLMSVTIFYSAIIPFWPVSFLSRNFPSSFFTEQNTPVYGALCGVVVSLSYFLISPLCVYALRALLQFSVPGLESYLQLSVACLSYSLFRSTYSDFSFEQKS